MSGTKTGPLDLRGVACPLNFFKVKLRLDRLAAGETLEVVLDSGEPIVSVSQRIKQEGHRIRSVNRIDDHYRVVIERV